MDSNLRKMIFPLITEEEKLPFYITSIGAIGNQHPVQRPEGFPNYHFLYTTKGKGRLSIGGRDFQIEENMGFFFPPGIPHEYYAVEEPWITCWFTFDGYAVKNLLHVTGLGSYEVFYVTDMERLHQLHGDVHTAAARALPSSSYDASHLLYRLLLELNSCIGSEASRSKHGRTQQLQPLMAYIEANFSKNITLDDMAKVTGVTPQHLCRLFKQAFSIRPFEYLTRYRLKKAKEILVGPSNLVLKEVAAITGFNDTSYFCSVFRQYEGMTPMEFKRMHKEF